MSIATVKAGGKLVDLHVFTGQVVDQQRSTYTETVRNDQVAAQNFTRSTSYNKIFLKAPSGEERSLEIVDKGFSARAGNTASFLWGIPKGKDKGDYLAVVNHDTGDVHAIRKPINDLASPPMYNMIIIIAVIFGCVGLVDLFQGNIGSAIIMTGIGAGTVFWIYKRQKALLAQVTAAAQSYRPA